jgi:hypothetical protein
MTSALTDIREQFAAFMVANGVDVSAYVPERITPPTVAIRPASPYFQTANFGDDYVLNLELVLLVPTRTNELESQDLDQLIEDVVVAVSGCDYATMGAVEQPFIQEANNAAYLATTIQIQLFLTI